MTLAIILIVLFVVLMICYNSLVNKRNAVENALSTIDTCLQTRLDLMTTLFEQVSITLDHEAKLYKELVELRNDGQKVKEEYDNKKVIQMDKKVSGVERKFFALCENYPELKSVETVCKAMDANVNVENQINAARRNYNNNVQDYRNGIQSFPNVIFAGLFGFRNSYELYKADEGADKRVSPKGFIK